LKWAVLAVALPLLLASGCERDRSTPALYKRNCARCHGAEGQGPRKPVKLYPHLSLLTSPMVRRGDRAAVRQQIVDAAEHQALQFDEALDLLGVPFDADRHPLTGCSLNYMPQGDTPAPPCAGHADRGYKLKYDLLFLLRDHADAVNVEVQYRAGLLARRDVERLFADYRRSLAELAAHA